MSDSESALPVSIGLIRLFEMDKADSLSAPIHTELLIIQPGLHFPTIPSFKIWDIILTGGDEYEFVKGCRYDYKEHDPKRSAG